ncbi:MAG: TonB-dependent receptor [Bdellovibrionales bacterium]|nr:TonB-dependent receptor [Bdellovibrionales bacterium]
MARLPLLRAFLLSAVLQCLYASAVDAEEAALDIDIAHTSIEDLINIEVTTVLRRGEPYFRSPAAVSVLTGEQIRRSGALTVPEALRLLPGVSVSRIDANKWAVSIRGFNSRTVSKLLVLVDGRSVYNQLFAGVFWEAQDVLLDDVDRIEVIRGPGGSLWGANAVNGVINIITKTAQDTQGGLFSGGGGNEEHGFAHARYGWQPSEQWAIRTYAKYLNRDEGYLHDREEHDRYEIFRSGFRADRTAEEQQSTLLGEFYFGDAGEPFNDGGQEVGLSGGSLLGRLQWTTEKAASELQAYYDYYRYDSRALVEDRHTFDVELDRRWQYLPNHSLYWALNYRITTDDILPGPVIAVVPRARTDNRVTTSLQEEWAIVPERLSLIVGTKLGYNDYTGIEVQPNVRIAYTPSDRHTFWGAISRAIRAPSRLEDDIIVPDTLQGNKDFHSEELLAYELGYRARLWEEVSFEIASFVYDQENLVSIDEGKVGNNIHGDAYGGEIAVNYVPTPWLRFNGSYSYVQLDLKLDPDGADRAQVVRQDEADPEHQFVLQTSIDFAENWELDVGARYVDRLSSRDVPSYTAAHFHLAWDVSRQLQVSLVGENLLDAHHFEQSGGLATQVERSLYARLRWRY